MAIKSNLEKHTISWLKRQNAEGKLNKDISIQRKEVWDAEKKSNLVVSVLLDIPIESLLFEENENGYNVLDGKQRTLALCAFLDDKLPLSEKIRVKELDGVSLVGKTYSELPEALRNKLDEYELSISILRPLESDERGIVFFMRNQAVALTKMDLSRVLLGEKLMDELTALSLHPFLAEKAKITEPARRKLEDVRVLIQFCMLCEKEQPSFSGNEIMSFCDDMKNGETTYYEDGMLSTMDYLDAAFDKKRQYLKKANLPIAMYVAKQAKNAGMKEAEFAEKLDKFFAEQEPDSEYMQACQAGSGKRTNVALRVKLMKEAVLGE